jgi:hypothetical protein
MTHGRIDGHHKIQAFQQRHRIVIVTNLGTDVDQRRPPKITPGLIGRRSFL